MLRRFKVKGFKSLAEVDVQVPRLLVLFGPNAAGKSNFLDAIQALSRIAACRTIADAISEPIRGHPVEAFAFPEGGLSALLSAETASFTLESDLVIVRENYRYRVEVGIQVASGSLTVKDEYLAALGQRGDPKGNPIIEKMEQNLRIRRKSKPAHPRQEPVGQNHTILSDLRLGGAEYKAFERCRGELSGWRTYYLDPRVAMRAAKPPSEVVDIGVLGEDIAPFLYRLRAEKPKNFDAIRRTLRSLIPSVEGLAVDLDMKRGTLDIMVRQGGTEFSSRVMSEGTLRVLALCAIAVNPWSGSLLAFEEPENGVHPRRLELIAKLIASIAIAERRQLIVTTHSPLFCDAMLREGSAHHGDISLVNVRSRTNRSELVPFDTIGPLFQDQEIHEALTSGTENGLFESLMMRGMIDE
ncbi:MAG: AAA family ATPase [Planctomycetes bacterium]|nr:AAA family ATPase [Planctomycetota bacterium]